MICIVLIALYISVPLLSNWWRWYVDTGICEMMTRISRVRRFCDDHRLGMWAERLPVGMIDVKHHAEKYIDCVTCRLVQSMYREVHWLCNGDLSVNHGIACPPIIDFPCWNNPNYDQFVAWVLRFFGYGFPIHFPGFFHGFSHSDFLLRMHWLVGWAVTRAKRFQSVRCGFPIWDLGISLCLDPLSKGNSEGWDSLGWSLGHWHHMTFFFVRIIWLHRRERDNSEISMLILNNPESWNKYIKYKWKVHIYI